MNRDSDGTQFDPSRGNFFAVLANSDRGVSDCIFGWIARAARLLHDLV